MNAQKTGLLCLLGALMLTLTACGSADLLREKDRENTDLRRYAEQLRLQAKAKDDEVRKLEAQLADAKKLQTQVTALEDRLRVMDDMMMSKSEESRKFSYRPTSPLNSTARFPDTSNSCIFTPFCEADALSAIRAVATVTS